MKRPTFTVGQRVPIHPDVTRTLWAVPCCWGGLEGTVTRTGARVNGIRFSRVDVSGGNCTFGGNDFADCVLEPIAPAAAQPDLFASAAVPIRRPGEE